MGDGEMALVPGVQYGLSSHDNFDEHKSLIFVKLTDSSYRAIQEYLKSRHYSPMWTKNLVQQSPAILPDLLPDFSNF
ncbi:hypothetical protein EAG_07806 [Camponotus floridanus]|uniref:RNA polymerase II elongation factor ELL N-terminal domain-containing protein n=1 Tax=Camponotus floridanus TaxID=104421 RepID=E1ZUX6_CAMFO|nr:hypothetical protein EAG_07806 [Camponotus floridanus]